jgi:hypothetical protein
MYLRAKTSQLRPLPFPGRPLPRKSGAAPFQDQVYSTVLRKLLYHCLEAPGSHWFRHLISSFVVANGSYRC